MENNCYPFVNTPLPYAYDALEPYIDEKTMHYHHDKHLQTYINNLNEVLENRPRLQKLPLEELIRASAGLPRELGTKIRNNAGGVYNHRFFFEGLANPAPKQPHGRLSVELERSFCSFENFAGEFKKAALSVFGSGYAWLVLDRCRLKIMTTPNQNSPIELRLTPILCLDVWEHAYYLKHFNDRGGYIGDWMHIINWERAEERFLQL